MPIAQGSRSSLAYVAQTDYSTAGTVSTNLPFSTHSLNLTKDRVAGNDIQSDRMARVDRHGNRTVAGDIVVDLRDATYDPFIEAAMMNTWSNNVLTVGTQDKYFTIQDYAADADAVRKFTGMTVNTMGVSIAPNQMVTTTFGMIGKDMDIGNAQTNIAAEDAEPTPFDSYNGTMTIDGTTSSIVTAIDFTVTNSFAPTFVVGQDTAPSLEYGRADVEGTVSLYYDSATSGSMIDRFVEETETALKVQVGDGTNTMTFEFPRCKINSADVGVDGPTSRIITASFVALYDSASGYDTNLKITRSA